MFVDVCDSVRVVEKIFCFWFEEIGVCFVLNMLDELLMFEMVFLWVE